MFNRRLFCQLLGLSLVVAGFLLWVPLVLADEKTAEMAEIVVTATRTEKTIEDTPASVSVVTQKDMEKRNITSIDEALNTTAGVANQRVKGILDTSPRVTVGGISGYQRTLVLLDGITLNNAYTGNVLWNMIMPEDVARIEVVKGPFSSLYGGYAMGGVVSIMTKMPEKREFTVMEGYGTAWSRGEAPGDLKTTYLSYGDKIDNKLRLYVSYWNNSTNGYFGNFDVQSSKPTAGITGWSATTDNKGNPRFIIGRQGQNTMWGDGVTTKVGYDFSATSKLLLSYIRSRYTYGYDIPETYLRNSAGNPVWSYGSVKEASFISSGGGSTTQNLYHMQYDLDVSSAKIKVNLGVMDVPTNYYVTPNSSTATVAGGPGLLYSAESGAYNADMQITLPIFKQQILTFGGSFRNGWSKSTDMNLSLWRDTESSGTIANQAQGKDRTYALFVQDEIPLLDNLTAYIGGREDWWETYDGFVSVVSTGSSKAYDNRSASSFSPKAALVYRPFSKTTLRTSIGTAFRPPSVYELYRTTVSSGITYAGNPDLQPETTTSWDVGVDQGLWKGATVKARYFEHYISDLIYARRVSATLQDKLNVGKAESKGIELEAEQRFDKWLRLFANFTYTDARIKENSAAPASVGKRVTYVPDILFNIGGDFERDPIGISVVGRYVGKRYNSDDNSDVVNNVYGSYDPFFTADAKIRCKLLSWATASFSVNNLFDEKYYGYYLSPGRSWFVDLTLKF